MSTYVKVGGAMTSVAAIVAAWLIFSGGGTLHCFNNPSSCGYPDPAAGNVGVPSGTTLTSSGSITTSANNQIINARNVTGTITVNHNNVTISNTRITGTGTGCGPTSTCGNSLILNACNCTLTISHVELTAGSPTTIEHGIRNQGGGLINVDHVYQHGNVDALCWCAHANISDSYSIIHLAIEEDHLENLYTDDDTLTANHNTFLNTEPQTANIFANTGNGGGGPCSNHLTITNNLLAGGGYSIYACGNASSDGTATINITGNRFARCDGGSEVAGPGGTWLCAGGADSAGYFPRSGSFGRLSSDTATTVWSGNIWDDDGSTASD